MIVQDIAFADAAGTRIELVAADGRRLHVKWPCETWHAAAVKAWLDAGNAIAPHTPPAATAEDVRTAAARRILAVYPAWMQANMTARGVELLRIGEAEWDAGEQAEADALQGAWDWIKSVRAASNAMEADPPADYDDDARWPAPPSAQQ